MTLEYNRCLLSRQLTSNLSGPSGRYTSLLPVSSERQDVTFSFVKYVSPEIQCNKSTKLKTKVIVLMRDPSN